MGVVSLLAAVNDAAMSISVRVSTGDSAFSPFGPIPRSGIARSCGSSLFSFSRNLQGFCL